MKKWENPEMVKLNINMTAYGDDTSKEPDWTIYSIGGDKILDQTFGPSGSEHPADAVVKQTQP
ncbi:MAG: hypothetical protein J5372_06115 [Lachnospiraceae bacterium]|nr:hypothetical protein [Lachnospiraceae bacterium]MBR4782103.1 hypothetical protein [Lachnospiraceae bacterium]